LGEENRQSQDRGFLALYFSFMWRAQIRRAARNFAISSKKFIWMQT
jgi:hypothetical protein